MSIVVKKLHNLKTSDKTDNYAMNQVSSRVHMKIYNYVSDRYKDMTDADEDVAFSHATDPGIWVVNTEPITYTINTTWAAGGGAAIAEKVNELLNSELMQLLAAGNVFTATPTDNWTQQTTKNGNPLSIGIKFRAYKDPSPSCSESYFNIIRLFTRLTSAPKKYSLIKNVVEPVSGVVKTGHQLGEKVVETFVNSEDGVGETFKAIVSQITDKMGFGEPTDPADAVRAQYTLALSSSGRFGNSKLDWILSSFTATPSQQVVFDKTKSEFPLPMWIDFDVSLETNIAPSNAYLGTFFNKK